MFAKFLLTVAVIAIIWFGFKYLERLNRSRTPKAAPRSARPRAPGPRSQETRFQPVDNGESVQDLIKCPHCGTYRSAKQGACGQADCPY